MNNKEALIEYLLDPSTSSKSRILAVDRAREHEDFVIEDVINYAENFVENEQAQISEEGYYGNVWVRKQYFPTASIIHQGHKHKHDHVSLLQKGTVKVVIEGEAEKIFKAPTFSTIAANKEHQINALEDDTLTWCVFALRKSDGTLTDYYNGDNSPYGHAEES